MATAASKDTYTPIQVQEAENGRCENCGSEEDAAHHTITVCATMERSRTELAESMGVTITIENIITRRK